ncbi:SBBP repeat-containing protein, partial [Methanococcus maripaludis]|uniref:SBBP repeat-containing protein n=1 Tax=Methanococcus maripaludis TaxID=39152 RepID=UPI00241E3DFF
MKIRHFIITSFIFLLCASFVNAEEAVWNDTFDYGDGRDIAVDLDGNSYVTGGKYDIVTIKYAPNGTRLWNSTLDFGATSEVGYSIALDNGGNAYVTGRGNDNFVTIKYAPNGTRLWNSTLD